MKKYLFVTTTIFWNLFIGIFLIKIYPVSNFIFDYIKSNYDIWYDITFIPFIFLLIANIYYNLTHSEIDKYILKNENLAILSSLILPIVLYFLENRFYTLEGSLFNIKVPLIITVFAIWLSYIFLNIYLIYRKPKGITDTYKIRVALENDINSPYIWFTNVPFNSRDIVKIINVNNSKSTWCEIIKISNNFIKRYNSNERTKKIILSDSFMVVNQWYRNKLGLEKNKSYEIRLEISKQPIFLKRIYSSLQHPDNTIRLATWLGILSFGLGIIGVIIGIIGCG